MSRTASATITARCKLESRNITQRGPWITERDVTGVDNSSYVTRDDISRTAVINGFRKPLPYHASGYTQTYPAFFYTGGYSNSKKVEYEHRGSGHLPMLIAPPTRLQTLVTTADKNRAVVNMLRAVGDSKWAAGETLAEIQSSIDLIGTSARTLSNAMLHASKKNWRGLAKSLGVPSQKVKKGTSASEGWLQFQFGWSPVVDDIANSALFISGALDGDDPVILMAKTRLQNTTKALRSSSYTWSGGAAYVDFGYTEKTLNSEEYKASVYFSVSCSSLRSLAQYGLVGLSTPWAVLPMSFVADWVLPIGDVLAAMDATFGLSYLGGSYTTFKKATRTVEFASPVFTAGYNKVTMSGNAYAQPVERFAMERVVWNSVPFPSPLYIKNPFDTFKAVTAVALLRQFSS